MKPNGLESGTWVRVDRKEGCSLFEIEDEEEMMGAASFYRLSGQIVGSNEETGKIIKNGEHKRPK